MAQEASYSKKVVKACETIADHVVSDIGPHGRGSPPLWPISIIEVNWYLSRFLPREIHRIFKGLEDQGMSLEEIARLFWGPSGITHLLYCADFGFEGLTPQESGEFIDRLVDIISCQRIGDPFCENWKNIVWSDDKVEETLATCRFFDAQGPDRKQLRATVAKLNTTLWHYCIFIQIGHRAYSHEFHGPYPLGGGESLLVREYYNLKPVEVWKFSSKMPFDRVTTLEVYRNIEIQVDAFGHLKLSDSSPGNFPDNLQRFGMRIEGQNLERIEELEALSAKCLGVLVTANSSVRSLAEEEKKQFWVKKLLDMRCFGLKPQKEILEEDWAPSNHVLGLVERTGDAERATGEYMKEMIGNVVGVASEEAKKRVTEMFLTTVFGKANSDDSS